MIIAILIHRSSGQDDKYLTSGKRILINGRITHHAVIEDWIVYILDSAKRYPLPWWDLNPHLVHGSLGPPEFIIQLAS